MTARNLSLLASLLLLIAGLSACAPSEMAQTNIIGEGDAADDQVVDDPAEGMNRAVFKFNEVVDNIILKPVATGYRAVVPKPGRKMVHNFLTNMESPVVLVSSLAQGDVHHAFVTFWRFVLNTTFGVGGLFDFASENTKDLVYRDEDLGQALGKWGAGPGPYLVLPIIGPSSGRDAVGLVLDVFADPFTYALEDDEIYIRYGLTTVDARERRLDIIDDIYRTSIDPYATIRSAYLQRRQADVENRTARDVKW
jgi:phospholipid-binding lipoprotein MlaA